MEYYSSHSPSPCLDSLELSWKGGLETSNIFLSVYVSCEVNKASLLYRIIFICLLHGCGGGFDPQKNYPKKYLRNTPGYLLKLSGIATSIIYLDSGAK